MQRFSAEGLGYTLGRASIDSCVFSISCYASCDAPGDTALAHFDVSRLQKYTPPLIPRGGEAAGQPVKITLTPWSPHEGMNIVITERFCGPRLKRRGFR